MITSLQTRRMPGRVPSPPQHRVREAGTGAEHPEHDLGEHSAGSEKRSQYRPRTASRWPDANAPRRRASRPRLRTVSIIPGIDTGAPSAPTPAAVRRPRRSPAGRASRPSSAAAISAVSPIGHAAPSSGSAGRRRCVMTKPRRHAEPGGGHSGQTGALATEAGRCRRGRPSARSCDASTSRRCELRSSPAHAVVSRAAEHARGCPRGTRTRCCGPSPGRGWQRTRVPGRPSRPVARSAGGSWRSAATGRRVADAR